MRKYEYSFVALPICFLCTVAILIASAIALYSAVVAVFPALAAYSQHPGLVEPDLSPLLPPWSPSPDQPAQPPPPPPSPEEIAKATAEAVLRSQNLYADALFQARRHALDNLVAAGCALVVALGGLLLQLRCLRCLQEETHSESVPTST